MQTELYVMNADWNGLRRLVRHASGLGPGPTSRQRAAQARAHVGQRRLVLMVAQRAKDRLRQHRDGNDEVYVINTDGSGPRNLTRNPARDGHPVWQPRWQP
jgi:hypothetical protein